MNPSIFLCALEDLSGHREHFRKTCSQSRSACPNQMGWRTSVWNKRGLCCESSVCSFSTLSCPILCAWCLEGVEIPSSSIITRIVEVTIVIMVSPHTVKKEKQRALQKSKTHDEVDCIHHKNYCYAYMNEDFWISYFISWKNTKGFALISLETCCWEREVMWRC